ncbi:FtsK/SpoIIIE domain-containing protein [Streptomyces sp. NBC_01571]|uniref:FtsK/SpoIIIE domain-containing protein n=1 Tax=Streptomyces sp. NBC_01571 TaxID=2975883 RepID=UPI002259C95C|nr:FtsK/SpoIIIE domain-containing protein [Streptomyces sp. NBC_01571]MCX4581387.1 FtsK/SpoIIIE domain-containing protein [Streptomyces sp. NBC_01571]
MSRKKQQASAGDDGYGQAAGAIGTLAIAFGILAAIKDKLGLSWPATVLLTAGALVALGYGAWRAKSVLKAWWASEKPTATEKKSAATEKQPAAAMAEEAPATAVIGGDQAAAQAAVAHPQLTAALAKAGVIGKDEIIRANEVTIEPVPKPGSGSLYDFLVPEGRTYKDVEKRLGNVAGMFGATRLHTKMERSRDNERRVRLLVLDEPPHTRPFSPPTRQQIETFDGVPFGHDVVGQLAGVGTFDKASLLVGGMTQMGKTTLVNGLITCLLIAYGEFDLYLLDGKFCGLTRFEKIAVRYEASDNPAVFEDMADELNARGESRYEKIKEAIRKRQPAPKFRPVFFIVDEAADFFAHDGTNAGKENAARVAEKARSLVAKCLESGISVVMLTQRPAQNAIPVMVRDQFLYRMCLYVASEGTAKVALGDTYFDTIAPINPALLDSSIKGQGVLFAHGVSTLIRGFNFSDEFIWKTVDEVDARQQQKFADAPVSPVKQAIDLMRSAGVDFMATADLAPAFGITETDPAKAGRQLNGLLKVASDKSTKGVRGYRLTDLTAAASSDS